jgi:flagellar hook assembly protein FlgD
MSKFTGTWHIEEMEMWDEDYFNMEVQAYITIDKNDRGEFQFGLVTGSIDGGVIKNESGEIFEFTWDGSDENDEASGSGWLKLKAKNTLEGKIKIHHGDSSLLSAKRA